MKVYVIYNKTKEEFIVKRNYYSSSGRAFMIYGDKRSASTKKNQLQHDYKDDILEVIEIEITKDMIKC